ncbi:integrase core domain-containing protein [Pandoraea sp. XJJ-1]|uniref:integrase core domain-containing protein n=1 Tax=Pandoraea sp. XJJ-1 TaxID=3002643 RepID=UPI0012412BFC
MHFGRQSVKRIETWRIDYQSARPHSALGQLAPAQFQHCINRNLASRPTYEWCTRQGKVKRVRGLGPPTRGLHRGK